MTSRKYTPKLLRSQASASLKIRFSPSQELALGFLPIFKHGMLLRKVWRCQATPGCSCPLVQDPDDLYMMDWGRAFLKYLRYRVVVVLRDPHVCHSLRTARVWALLVGR
jgi:hypothetical protein